MAAPLILHTPGEPGGIGLECLIKLAQTDSPACRLALTDPALLLEQATRLGLPLDLREFKGTPKASAAGVVYVEPWTATPAAKAGECLEAHATMQIRALDRAVDLLCEKAALRQPAALVTGPVQKSSLAKVKPGFRGHTEYLAQRAGVDRVVMMLACETLRVALVTTHIPLKDVPCALNRDDIVRCIRILAASLRDSFGIFQPRIAVCSLNPHAGEDGLLGDEEIRIIQPAIKEAQDNGIDLSGPWPADTIFTARRLKGCDAVLAMYHDQGLPTLKYAGFGNSVNVTLGLPFIRTSVDHGTGLDIAGQGIADESSLRAAENMALRMAQASHTPRTGH